MDDRRRPVAPPPKAPGQQQQPKCPLCGKPLERLGGQLVCLRGMGGCGTAFPVAH